MDKVASSSPDAAAVPPERNVGGRTSVAASTTVAAPCANKAAPTLVSNSTARTVAGSSASAQPLPMAAASSGRAAKVVVTATTIATVRGVERYRPMSSARLAGASAQRKAKAPHRVMADASCRRRQVASAVSGSKVEPVWVEV